MTSESPSSRPRRRPAPPSPPPTADEVLLELRQHENPVNVAGMARYGIVSANARGIPAPVLESIARRIGRDHQLAADLWATGVYEARQVAGMVDDPALVTDEQMEAWAAAFDSWALCDGVCSKLFDRTPHAWRKVGAWSRRREEYVKRAAFVLMAALAVHDKASPDARFLACLPIIDREADDDRNFVKKAVNWALRQIGKRALTLNRAAVETATRLRDSPSSPARWIGSDALRELTSPAVQARLAARERRRQEGGRGSRLAATRRSPR